MLYFDGRPILKFDCHDRSALEVMFRSGISLRATQLLGRGGATTYWRVTRLAGFLPNLGGWFFRHVVMFANFAWKGKVTGCNCFFRSKYWPWGRFEVDDQVAYAGDGGQAVLLDHGQPSNCWWSSRRLRYYLRTTGDPCLLLGKCCASFFGREIFLGYFVLTRLGG